MGISAKAKSGSDGWGLGFLLVFFPEEDNDDDKNVDKKRRLSFSSSSSSSSSRSTSSRCSRSNLLISRAQSTFSICALLLFVSLLLFTLCTFEPTSTNSAFPRRWLSQDSRNSKIKSKRYSSSSSSNWVSKIWERNSDSRPISSVALQGMGTLFRRGTQAMSDLLVAHLDEDTTDDELRLFLRTLHRSGLTARSDVVLIFPSSIPSNSTSVIQEENDSFLKLVRLHRESNNSASLDTGFDVTHFVKSNSGDRQEQQPLWGRRIHGNWSEAEGGGGEDEFTELRWGSVVGFESTELDPENSLAGFLDHVPMSLRRWATYPMLLGRVRRNFKHLMLVDIKNVVVLGDALARARSRSAESVYLWTTTETAHRGHGRKNSDKTQSRNQSESKQLNPAAIVGGARGVRRLSNAVLTEIVRAVIQHKSRSKGKSSVSESAILNQLVQNSSLLKNIEVMTATESIPDPSWFVSRKSNSSEFSKSSNYPLVHRGNNNLLNLHSILRKEICSFVEDSSVYRDCSQ
ncbi:uncharacterized protein LOC122062722 [Macadamia integrifolia]|uniref:uncharacterized protein LOC122062722 n=1 Tax=Macadamia integrifolia TaxID=60698 RepID=UPI001C4E483F|nr:uncharacterized protein LOC122062722 [Macadamia integrifolia]